VKVGCCGFPYGMKKYFEQFNLVEVQKTFYNLPRLETVTSWREKAPETFEFTIKAWQVITHPPSSPTWRKAKITISEEKLENYGSLKPTWENLKAWERVLEVAKALKSKIIVLQTPPSFKLSNENIENVKEFFSRIKRDNFIVAWEPRGEWNSYEGLKEILEEYSIVHVVDIFKRMPILHSKANIAYIRLHGLNGEVNYKYKYKPEDLRLLTEKLIEISGKVKVIYVLFNNVYMGEDAKAFKEYCKQYGLECI